jgi:lipoyl(octanoyl) transferase
MSLGESRPNQDVLRQANEFLKMPTQHVASFVRFLQPIPYTEAWTIQKRLQEERIAEKQRDILLLLEHPPIYTMGRTTQPTHWGCGEEVLRRTGAGLQLVDRGGSITYHGPGQVIGYPILKLSHYCPGPKQYIWKLEEMLIHMLLRWGIEGYRLEKRPGVWVRRNQVDAKIAAVGVRIDHGVTIHGFALNVDLDLTPFSYIMPCGITQCHITSMAEVRQSPVSFSIVVQQITQEFSRIFNIRWTNSLPNTIRKKQHNSHLSSMSAQ